MESLSRKSGREFPPPSSQKRMATFALAPAIFAALILVGCSENELSEGEKLANHLVQQQAGKLRDATGSWDYICISGMYENPSEIVNDSIGIHSSSCGAYLDEPSVYQPPTIAFISGNICRFSSFAHRWVTTVDENDKFCFSKEDDPTFEVVKYGRARVIRYRKAD